MGYFAVSASVVAETSETRLVYRISHFSLFSASSKLFHWSLFLPLRYLSLGLNQAAFLILNSAQTL